MNTYHISVLIGLGMHLVLKYIVADGWTLKAFIGGEWRYVVTSLVLTACLAVFGPQIVDIVVSMLPGAGDAGQALKDAPNLVGFLIGSTGGSVAYNLPLVGQMLKDVMKPKTDA